MRETVGRNDTCPCGSGRKYKKCCMVRTLANPNILDFEWRKLRKLEGAVFDQHLIPYAWEELPNVILKQAIEDCLPEDLPEALEKELLFNNFFIPWFLFNWIPLDDFGVDQFEPDMTIAQNYKKYHEKELNSIERHFLEAMNQGYYSFYCVLNVEPEKLLVIKDILLGTTHNIKERQGTYHLKRGDVIFTRILTLDGQSIFVGMAPFIIPPDYHNDLIDFRKWLVEENDHKRLSPDVLRDEFDMELLDYFFDIMRSAFNRPMPTLVNTDDELLQFSKSQFKLSAAPEEALNCLLPLTLSKDPKEFLNDAERNESGEISRISFPWLKKGNKRHKDWANTVMGNVTIGEGRLTLETNSEKRTQRGKKLLIKYLGNVIYFQQTLIESPEQKLQSLSTSPDTTQEDDHLLELPEAQEQIQVMAKGHWESWFDEPIPALDGKTPRETAKTEEGRERLEALLLLYERHDLKRGDDNLWKADIHYLRTELALDE